MRYQIKWAEQIKTGEKNGKFWAMSKMTLTDPNGKDTENVTTFDSVMTGSFIEGEIVQNGQYLNFKTTKQVNGSNFKTAQIEKTMERKEQSIGKFQDNKEWSIKLASSMGKAVDLAIASLKNEDNLTETNYHEAILSYRKWILNNWDVEPTDLDAF